MTNMSGNGNDELTWTETINSFVRSAVTLMFGVSVCYGFLFARIDERPLMSSDGFSTVAMAVILWWFKDRGDKEKAKETAALMAAATTTAASSAANPESAANPQTRSTP